MPLPLVRMPSLDLLKGFVAVGRRLSVTQAADDLCITQSAMSKQIRALEDALGVKLLQRGQRGVRFTQEGERLFRAANAAVLQMQDALQELSAQARQPVTLTTSTGVAGLWLLPRLGGFQAAHPGIDVRIATTNAVLDLDAERVDLAIRYCAESQAPRGAVRLFGESIGPVASPSLGLGAFGSARTLAGQVLLEFDDARRPWLQWGGWLAARGWSASQARGMLRFNHYEQLIQAAVAGQGVALGRLELLAPLLGDARLRQLEDGAPGPCAYWLIQAQEQPRGDVELLAEWIEAAAREGRESVAG